jgi:hypothetical protein
MKASGNPLDDIDNRHHILLAVAPGRRTPSNAG